VFIPRSTSRRFPLLIVASCALALGVSACGAPASQEPVTVRVLTHDSFALTESLVDDFERESGITVEFIAAGDAGELVNRAVLASGNPDGDVLFGVDTTLLSRAIDADVFDPYVADAPLDAGLVAAGEGVVTPIDDGDVCINIDDGWFLDRDIPAPQTLADLVDPTYADLLVVANPATSSPGLAFLLATVARYGDGWSDYWQGLRDNGVKVVNGWSEAYFGEFSGGGDGDRPLVVSYATSPPAEIVYASDPKPQAPSTSVMLDGCFQQVEFAGVLRGSPHPEAARQVVDWLVSPEVQADIPLSMFVFPARRDTPLPEVFEQFALRPTAPLTLDAQTIADNRANWVEQWTQIVLR
jgi:thiamine transport system substrate-binding protein